MDIKTIAVENKEAAIGGLVIAACCGAGAFLWRRHKNKGANQARTAAYQEVINNLKKAERYEAAMNAVKEPSVQSEESADEIAVVQATIRPACHPRGWQAATAAPEVIVDTEILCPGDPRFTRRGFTSWVNSEGCVGVVHITKANTSVVWRDENGSFYGISTIKERWKNPTLTIQEVENFLKGR